MSCSCGNCPPCLDYKTKNEIILHLKECLKIMESEPVEDLTKLKKDVYHNLKRILGDE